MKSVVSVITPAVSVDLTILANVKAELGITSNTEDANLETWIDQASGVITAACNRVFAQETVLETFRNRNWLQEYDRVVLNRRPVTDVASVVLDDEALVEDSDYEVDYETGILLRLSNDCEQRWNFRKLAVTYTAGYELLGTLPIGIERACISLVKQYRSAATRDPLLKSEDIPGVISQSFWVGGAGNIGLPPDVETLIAPYREIQF